MAQQPIQFTTPVVEVDKQAFDKVKDKEGVETKTIEFQNKEEVEKAKKKLQESGQVTNYGASDPYIPNINLGGGGGSGQGALIVFVVVGLIIMIAWIPYMFGFIYNAIVNPEDLDFTHTLSFDYDRFYKSDRNTDYSLNSKRSGYVYSATYSFYMTQNKASHYGFSTQVGKHYIKDEFLFLDKSEYEGIFFMFGPSIQYRKLNVPFSGYMQLDLLGGTSDHNSIGLMSSARINLGFVFGKVLFAIHFSGIYFDVNDNKGILTDENDLLLSYGLKTGYTF
jgi:hypothetical protein